MKKCKALPTWCDELHNLCVKLDYPSKEKEISKFQRKMGKIMGNIQKIREHIFKRLSIGHTFCAHMETATAHGDKETEILYMMNRPHVPNDLRNYIKEALLLIIEMQALRDFFEKSEDTVLRVLLEKPFTT